MAEAFLDSNVILRHVLGDDPDQSPRCTAYLGRVERKDVRVRTADTVVFEVVFTLQRQYRQSKEAIRDAILPLLGLPGIILPGKRRLSKVFELYIDYNISFADAYHAILMQEQKLTDIVSFDRGFDRLPAVTRIEP